MGFCQDGRRQAAYWKTRRQSATSRISTAVRDSGWGFRYDAFGAERRADQLDAKIRLIIA